MISINDDIFNYKILGELYKLAIGSNFTLGFHDSISLEKKQYYSIHSPVDINSIKELNLFESFDKISEYKDIKNNLQYLNCIINLNMFTDSNFSHVHPKEYVMLIYLNTEWLPNWAGETVFFDDNCNEVIKSVTPKPGRVVFFDGSIPHSIRCQNQLGPQFRFTMSLFFKLWKN